MMRYFKVVFVFLLTFLVQGPISELKSAPVFGQIEGRVVLKGKSKKEQVRLVSGVVIYLVPQGHEVLTELPKSNPKISQKNAKFNPPLMVVPKGATVDFPNDDTIDHNVFSFSRAKRFDLGIYPQGDMKAVTFNKEGVVLLFCSIHEFMTGVLYVTPSHLNAVTDKKGRFQINEVPTGRYQVRALHLSLPEGTEYVELTTLQVESGKPATIEIDISKGLASSTVK